MKRFCPKCGTEKGPFIKGFCMDCFVADHNLVELPEKINVETCKRCGSVRVRGVWQNYSPELIEEIIKANVKEKEFLLSTLKADYTKDDQNNISGIVRLVGNVDTEPFSFTLPVLIKQVNSICDSCMKLASNFYDGILQVRFSKDPSPSDNQKTMKKIEELLQEAKKEDKLAQIIDVLNTKKGYDLYIASKTAGKFVAERLAKYYRSEVTRSFSVKGIDSSGKPKKKFTFCVRVA